MPLLPCWLWNEDTSQSRTLRIGQCLWRVQIQGGAKNLRGIGLSGLHLSMADLTMGPGVYDKKAYHMRPQQAQTFCLALLSVS